MKKVKFVNGIFEGKVVKTFGLLFEDFYTESIENDNNIISLKWRIEDSDLIKAYKYLMSHDCLDAKTTLEQFKAAFTGQPIINTQPIKWIEDTKLLAYFLDKAITDPKWQSIAGKGKLFLSKNEKPITANNLSKSKKDYKDTGKPKDHEKIDDLLKDIQKH